MNKYVSVCSTCGEPTILWEEANRWIHQSNLTSICED